MITAVDIFDEVEADVTTLNGEIVRRAFHGSCCQFFNNQEEFKQLLHEYINMKLLVRKMSIRLDGKPRYEYRGNFQRLSPDVERSYSRLRDAQMIRHNLKLIWPCAACIWLYNPTNRIRRFPQLA